MYQYWGFGLNIHSELAFPELSPHDFDIPDVVISRGVVSMPADITYTTDKLEERIISDNDYYLHIRGVCAYHVLEGREVTIDPVTGAGDRDVRMYCLGTVMAVVLLQKGLIPLHASGILKDGALYMVTGDSGAGKSTTLAWLVANGYRIFTDDICVLRTEAQTVNGTASYPMMKLWDDAVNKLGQDAYAEKTFKVNGELDKYGYFFYDTFLKESYPIRKIFVLKKSETAKQVSVRQLSGMEAFSELEKQAYRKYLITDQSLRELHFRTMSALTRQCAIYEITRPVAGTVDLLAAALAALF